MPDRVEDLGPCCCCGELDNVRTIIMLPWRCSVPGHGWACLRCGLPPEGCVVVLCDDCMEYVEAGLRVEEVAKEQCRGYPGGDGREPLDPLGTAGHVHRMEYHPEAEPGDDGR